MTNFEAMRALESGKRLRDNDWDEGTYIFLQDGNVYMQYSTGFPRRRSLPCETAGMVEFTEPNPHPAGTFAWAVVEARRGHKVCRKGSVVYSEAARFKNDCLWHTGDVLATDWEVVL